MLRSGPTLLRSQKNSQVVCQAQALAKRKKGKRVLHEEGYFMGRQNRRQVGHRSWRSCFTKLGDSHWILGKWGPTEEHVLMALDTYQLVGMNSTGSTRDMDTYEKTVLRVPRGWGCWDRGGQKDRTALSFYWMLSFKFQGTWNKTKEWSVVQWLLLRRWIR